MNHILSGLLSTFGEGDSEDVSQNALAQFADYSCSCVGTRNWKIACRQIWGLLEQMRRCLTRLACNLPHQTDALAQVESLQARVRPAPAREAFDLDAWRVAMARLGVIQSCWEEMEDTLISQQQASLESGWIALVTDEGVPFSARISLLRGQIGQCRRALPLLERLPGSETLATGLNDLISLLHEGLERGQLRVPELNACWQNCRRVFGDLAAGLC